MPRSTSPEAICHPFINSFSLFFFSCPFFAFCLTVLRRGGQKLRLAFVFSGHSPGPDTSIVIRYTNNVWTDGEG